MVGLDTNVLLRWLIAPDEWDIGSSRSEIDIVQKTLLADNVEFYVNAVVLAETTWILEQKLKLSRKDVCEVLDRLLYSANVVVAESDAMNEARLLYERTNIGFADCLIARMNLRAGCTHTLTFDKKAGRETGFRDVRTPRG